PILAQGAVLIAELMLCFRLWEILATTRYFLRVGKGVEGQIDYIVLTSMNLMGSISKRFADLTSLYALDLFRNFLTGNPEFPRDNHTLAWVLSGGFGALSLGILIGVGIYLFRLGKGTDQIEPVRQRITK
ncbi:unnamed protein product, partial [Brassica rapa subsp. trilocularis]